MPRQENHFTWPPDSAASCHCTLFYARIYVASIFNVARSLFTFMIIKNICLELLTLSLFNYTNFLTNLCTSTGEFHFNCCTLHRDTIRCSAACFVPFIYVLQFKFSIWTFQNFLFFSNFPRRKFFNSIFHNAKSSSWAWTLLLCKFQ